MALPSQMGKFKYDIKGNREKKWRVLKKKTKNKTKDKNNKETKKNS